MAISKTHRRGGPLVALVVLGTAWIGARAMFWQSPYLDPQSALPDEEMALAPASMGAFDGALPRSSVTRTQASFARGEPSLKRVPPGGGIVRVPLRRNVVRVSLDPRNDGYSSDDHWTPEPREYAAQSSRGHAMLWRAAMHQSGRGQLEDPAFNTSAASRNAVRGVSPTGPVTPQITGNSDRWMLDAWGFFRQGTNAAPISQGRVPTYGASQAGAKLAFRLAPQSRHDPRLFVRAYRALIANGESELAAGGSARILPQIPVRIAGEARLTETIAGIRFRPAAYAFTEIAPVSLPGRFSLEAYAQGGYVGGKGATAFADGQINITRPVTSFTAGKLGNARLSVGGGAWGGAQRGANRVDIGPTMRVDMAIGKVPARISVDWRQKIAGDAAPESGVAATLSTRF